MRLLLLQLAGIFWERRPGPLTYFLSFEEANREMAFRAFFPNSSFDGCVKGDFWGFKPEFNLMDLHLHVCNQSSKSVYKSNIYCYCQLQQEMASDLCFVSLIVDMFKCGKVKFYWLLLDWCRYLQTCLNTYLGGQLKLIPPETTTVSLEV